MKKIFIIIGLLALTFIAVFFITANTTKETPAPTAPTPTLVPASPTTIKQNQLEIMQTLPVEDLSTKFLPIQQVAFIFNEPVAAKDLMFAVSPFTEAVARQGDNPNIVIVSSKIMWNEGVTTITILPNTKSVNGKSLNKNYAYTMVTEFPKEEHGESADY